MSRSAKKIITALTLLVGVFFVFKLALAATPDLGMQFGASIGLSSADPRIIASRIIQILLGFLGIIAVGLIIYAGFLWMTAAGNEDKIEQAKKILVSAVIGLIIILSAFGIATFILGKLLEATGSGTDNGGGGGPGSGIGGAGIIGVCSVESVYPAPNQKEVARNTSIIVAFKEDIDPTTICEKVTAGRCEGSLAKISNVKIYKSKDDYKVDANLVADVQVFNVDGKTFMFRPKSYLGSASEYLWYSVHLTNGLVKPDGKSVFESCQGDYLEWQFEVSNKIDLTPPQILSGGVFPPPDNARDTVNSSPALQASGSIVVNSAPKVYAPASVASVVPLNPEHRASVTVDQSYDKGGALIMTVFDNGGTLSAELKKGSVLLGAPSISDKTISFPGLRLTADNALENGDQWTINVRAVTMPDALTVGSMTYVFVAKDPAPNQIVSAGTPAAMAARIQAALETQTDVNAEVAGNRITITAVSAGRAGNNISLNFNSPSDSRALVLSGSALSGGAEGNTAVTIGGGRLDEKRNAVIQINFNEPIFPNNIVGDAAAVRNVIRVINVGTGAMLTGKFTIANQYRTLEFISDSECGMNGCGEKIYCLPANSNLRVEIMAANLSAVCATNDNCLDKSPYNRCGAGNICSSPADGNYPQGSAAAADGVMDLNLNSLDGNRNNKAEGQASVYNENIPNAAGDNFSWSFFIGDVLDLDAPRINLTKPNKDAETGLVSDLEIDFNKLMMVSTLKTGSTVSNNGQADVVHKNINVWNLASNPLGYWIASEPVLANGSPVSTNAIIKHSDLNESMSYRAQVGSGVRDIYQNCFKVSAGPACVGANAVTEARPSCCNGLPVPDLGPDGNCP